MTPAEPFFRIRRFAAKKTICVGREQTAWFMRCTDHPLGRRLLLPVLDTGGKPRSKGITMPRAPLDEGGAYFSGLSPDEIGRLAERYGSDGLGTGGVDGYFIWLAQARPLAMLELLVMLLPAGARTWDEFNEWCRRDGWGERLGFALRDCYQEAAKRVEAKQAQEKQRRR
jgi:hypothetical protein